MEFVHIGVPTREKQPGETYVEGLKVHLTNPDDHEYKFEYLRFEPESCLPAELQVFPHIAVKVPCLQEALSKCQEVLVQPMQASDTLTIAFGKRDGVYFEFMKDTGGCCK